MAELPESSVHYCYDVSLLERPFLQSLSNWDIWMNNNESEKIKFKSTKVEILEVRTAQSWSIRSSFSSPAFCCKQVQVFQALDGQMDTCSGCSADVNAMFSFVMLFIGS